MKKLVLRMILYVARAFGAFWIARKLTQGHVRILCYHGAAIDGENQFRGSLFMRPVLFSQRMKFLSDHNYPVIDLEEAMRRMDSNSLPTGATVITIDDGWWGTIRFMGPILAEHNFPSTLYIASYYMEKQTQVFNVALAYLLWRTDEPELDLGSISDHLTGQVDLQDPDQRERALESIWSYADTLPSAVHRQQLLRLIGDQVGVDVKELEEKRMFAYMNEAEARSLADYGMDVQLHTHRHKLPSASERETGTEISDNRRSLESVCRGRLVHFCYPSGEFEEYQIPWLQNLGVETATTTKSGFVTRKTHKLKLGRFLDSEYISEIEFAAEMSGLFELVRRFGYAI